ncbi:MAG: acylphosphatase [Scrofimicrobium sp.]
MVSDQHSKKALDLRIRGRVQGVGLRYRLKWKADELDIEGWARNELDGTVSVHVQGMGYRIDHFRDWLRAGVDGVYISRIDVEASRFEPLGGFEIIG